eukprot:CAMPEP_0202837794 /NCGR_PEP_ID=MMETSP1389-20130828/47155_1 /ASSEMBLY_ACC=CAM_ASM_000865 /TAXON_ID=302021 /ORGANISM="Rhodomonas sp., Strain CCMP768" /LENGTH=67 /DNA_ID=CAMNT_0049513935 /DNA_START=262 /DNA_END=465 /DNA_ORIENTATION=-
MPFWLPLLFFTSIIWVPFVLFLVAAATVINFVILVRVLSRPWTQRKLNAVYDGVTGNWLFQTVVYDQ